MKFDFAPIRYSRAVGSLRPISEVGVRSIEEFGESKFEAHAFLSANLIPTWAHKPQLYGAADGTGTSKRRSTAVYKSISEALERWAFFESCYSRNAKLLGFNLEPTTSGMAAYPTFFEGEPREIALLEARERWSISAWWEGLLSVQPVLGSQSSFSIWRIVAPFQDSETVILEMTVQPEWYAYGFASGRSLKHAISRAKTELVRNSCLLNSISNSSSAIALAGELDVFEKRLLFFAGPIGNKAFKLRTANKCSQLNSTPQLLVDSRVYGPWCKFARIWRCLYSMPSRQHLSDSESYFFF